MSKTERIRVRVTVVMKDLVRRAAADADMTESEWLVQTIRNRLASLERARKGRK